MILHALQYAGVNPYIVTSVEMLNTKSTEVQNPRRILQSRELCQCACAEIDHAPWLAERVVLSVLAPTRASGISRHRFGQG